MHFSSVGERQLHLPPLKLKVSLIDGTKTNYISDNLHLILSTSKNTIHIAYSIPEEHQRVVVSSSLINVSGLEIISLLTPFPIERKTTTLQKM